MTTEHPIDASVIIVSYNTSARLRECLSHLLANPGKRQIEVIVVDNASADDSAQMVRERFADIELICSTENLGFAAGNNLAMASARGRYVVLLNPDALLTIESLDAAIEAMDMHQDVGLAGARLKSPAGTDQPSGRLFPSLMNEFLTLSGLAARFPQSRLFGRFDRTWARPEDTADVDWVPGAFTIVRRSALGGDALFDERFFLYYEEVDLCRRLKHSGWRIQYWPWLVVQHWGGESSRTVADEAFSDSGAQLTLWRMRSALLYYRKHHGPLMAWLVARLEREWHRLRAFKASRGAQSGPALRKRDESTRTLRLMDRAWHDTLGGRISPPRPW